jgi:hypothetical protein
MYRTKLRTVLSHRWFSSDGLLVVTSSYLRINVLHLFSIYSSREGRGVRCDRDVTVKQSIAFIDITNKPTEMCLCDPVFTIFHTKYTNI